MELVPKEESYTIKGWIARDENEGFLGFYTQEPSRRYGVWVSKERYYALPQDAFRHITFESGAVECELLLNLKKQNDTKKRAL